MAIRAARISPILVATTLLLAGCGRTEDPPPVAAQPPAVTVARVAKQDVTPRSTFTGRIDATNKVDLGGVPDPPAVEGRDEDKRRAFLDASTALKRRIELFTSLPIGKLDKLALQSRLREIGKA